MKRILLAILLLTQLFWGQTTVTVTGNYTIASTIGVTWTASVTPTVTYRIYKSEISGGPYGQIGSGISCCSVTDANVRKSHTYYYVVTAFDGTTESANSTETSASIP